MYYLIDRSFVFLLNFKHFVRTALRESYPLGKTLTVNFPVVKSHALVSFLYMLLENPVKMTVSFYLFTCLACTVHTGMTLSFCRSVKFTLSRWYCIRIIETYVFILYAFFSCYKHSALPCMQALKSSYFPSHFQLRNVLKDPYLYLLNIFELRILR